MYAQDCAPDSVTRKHFGSICFKAVMFAGLIEGCVESEDGGEVAVNAVPIAAVNEGIQIPDRLAQPVHHGRGRKRGFQHSAPTRVKMQLGRANIEPEKQRDFRLFQFASLRVK